MDQNINLNFFYSCYVRRKFVECRIVLGLFLDIISENPSASKSNRLHVESFDCPLLISSIFMYIL